MEILRIFGATLLRFTRPLSMLCILMVDHAALMGGITKSRPLQIGGIVDFHADLIGGITEYPGPPPVVNDMSLRMEGTIFFLGRFMGGTDFFYH